MDAFNTIAIGDQLVIFTSSRNAFTEEERKAGRRRKRGKLTRAEVVGIEMTIKKGEKAHRWNRGQRMPMEESKMTLHVKIPGIGDIVTITPGSERWLKI